MTHTLNISWEHRMRARPRNQSNQLQAFLCRNQDNTSVALTACFHLRNGTKYYTANRKKEWDHNGYRLAATNYPSVADPDEAETTDLAQNMPHPQISQVALANSQPVLFFQCWRRSNGRRRAHVPCMVAIVVQIRLRHHLICVPCDPWGPSWPLKAHRILPALRHRLRTFAVLAVALTTTPPSLGCHIYRPISPTEFCRFRKLNPHTRQELGSLWRLMIRSRSIWHHNFPFVGALHVTCGLQKIVSRTSRWN